PGPEWRAIDRKVTVLRSNRRAQRLILAGPFALSPGAPGFPCGRGGAAIWCVVPTSRRGRRECSGVGYAGGRTASCGQTHHNVRNLVTSSDSRPVVLIAEELSPA